MSIYLQTLQTLSEAAPLTEGALPPAHQSWHDFNRTFFGDGTNSDMNEFIEEYLDWQSGLVSFLEDEDNGTVKQSLNDYGTRFVTELQNCTMLDWSDVIEKLAPLLYD